MALCTWHDAILFRRIWPQVDRPNDFNLCRLLKLLSAVAEEAGFTRSNLTSASTVGNVARMVSTSVFNTDSYLLARTPTCKKIVPPNVGGTKNFIFARFARESRFVPPLLKPWRRPWFKLHDCRDVLTQTHVDVSRLRARS